MTQLNTYLGSCHCGAVKFEVTTDLQTVMDCNCSHCSRKGFVLTFVPPERFKLVSGADSLGEYRFNRKVIQHLFCRNCGVEPFAHGNMPDGSPVVMVNLRCVSTVDISSLKVQHFNGKEL